MFSICVELIDGSNTNTDVKTYVLNNIVTF